MTTYNPRVSRALIAAAILGAGLLTGNGLAAGLSADRRVGPAAVYVAGVLAMTANFGVQVLMAALIVRINRRFPSSPIRGARLIDLLVKLALATLAAAALTRGMAWLGLGEFIWWSRFFPATTLATAMIIGLGLEPTARQGWHRVVVPLFGVQLVLTAAFTLL
ncbi:MAG TPA: hypothetical protein VIJ03_00480 [Candidatus Dormibacteraeota bacterium]